MSAWDLSVELLPVLASLLLSATLLSHTLRRAESRGAMYIAWIMVGQLGWGITYLVQLTTRYRELLLLVDHLLLMIVPIPAIAWFLFALEYAGLEDWYRPYVLALVFSVPAITWVLVPTNAVHMLFWSDYVVEFGVGSGLVLPDSAKGIWFWVHGVHLYLLTLVACLLVIRRTLYTHAVFRMQTLVLIVAAVVPLVVNIVDRLQYTAIDYSVVSFAVTAAVLLFGLYRYELFNLGPVARDTVLEEIRDAMIVLEHNGRIVDYNRAAMDILQLDQSIVGDPAGDVLPFHRLETDGGTPISDQNLTLTDGGTDRHYRLNTTPLRTDRTAEQFGRVLVLQDITELKRREQELEETNDELARANDDLEETNHELKRTNEELEILNRMVRHDIRNDLSIVKGYTQLLETELDEDTQETLDPILRNTEHAIELTETVRDLVRSISGDGTLDTEPVPIVGIVETEVQKARHAHAGAVFEVAASDSTADGDELLVRGNDMLSSIVHNLLSNAVRHNDTETPEVTVKIESDTASKTVALRVADNGPGIPPEEREAIFGRGEKGLESPGTGIGLYLVDSLVEQFGGSVTITDNEPRGAVFVVELERVTVA